MNDNLLLALKDGQYRVTSKSGVCGTGEFVEELFKLFIEHDMTRISNVTIFFNSNKREPKAKRPSSCKKTEASFKRV